METACSVDNHLEDFIGDAAVLRLDALTVGQEVDGPVEALVEGTGMEDLSVTLWNSGSRNHRSVGGW